MLGVHVGGAYSVAARERLGGWVEGVGVGYVAILTLSLSLPHPHTT